MNEATPDQFDKARFDQRKRAFGWSTAQLQKLKEAAQKSDVNEFYLFKELRSMMLCRLISTNGAATVKDLCDILQKEQESNVPAPVPQWYQFSDMRFGPCREQKRRFGYTACAKFGCVRTEDLETQFRQCSKCKLVSYCSRECQVDGWKARHKNACKQAASEADKTAKVSQMLEMFARMHE